MTITELIAPEGCIPSAELTCEQRIALLRLARIEFEFEGYPDDGDVLTSNVLFGVRTRYPVVIQDRSGGGYLIAQAVAL
jgi:hypothetical protein